MIFTKINRKINLFKSCMLLGMFMLGINAIQAASPEETFEQANSLYAEGKFNEAVELYTSLLEEDYISAPLFYNLGNAYFKGNRNVEAILYFEKALKMNPRNADYLHNLAVANSKIENNADKLSEFFINAWWKNLASFFSSTGWSILALILFWTGVGAVLVWLFAVKRKYKKIGFFIAPVFILLSIIPFLLANSRAQFIENSQTAIVMEVDKTLKTAPDSTVDVGEIAAGTKVKLLDTIGEWKKVQTPNGEIGWLKKSTLAEI